MHSRLRRIYITTLAAFLALSTAPVTAGDNLVTSDPTELGFSPQRLARLDTVMEELVRDKELAGFVTLVARHGEVFHHRAYGMRDTASATPMTRDTIFRIYSMTKPIIGVAMMILYEEGKWRLTDPVHKFIPEFRELKVYAGEDKNGNPVLEKPDHAPTMRELMTHTAGFTYGVFGETAVDKLYREKDVLDMNGTLDDMIAKLSELPLLYQPGTRWHYSVAVDIQGYLVQKLSGQPLPDFLRDRIFKPLAMSDTGFYVPEEKQDRFATLYSYDEKEDALREIAGDQFGAGDYITPPSLPSGGAGLVSTAGDYLRFCQMLLNGGELEGARILAPGTVKLLRADHLPEDVRFFSGMFPGTGFGLDFAVTKDPIRDGTLTGKDTYYWGGAAGTWFWIDPEYDIVLIGMIQRMGAGVPGSRVDMRYLSTTALYQALVDPGK